jgi:hypothetical protein
MNEKDMEDLIASYPDDFFFKNQFVLVARQQSLAGVGRFDLLFEDRFKSTILMELKARTLKYEDATQVANYRDDLKQNGCKNVVMWLVAPQIPNSVREFLDDKGIEYTEIHAAEFRRVAERHGLSIAIDAGPPRSFESRRGPRSQQQEQRSIQERAVYMLDMGIKVAKIATELRLSRFQVYRIRKRIGVAKSTQRPK